jgi:glutathione S-transferase
MILVGQYDSPFVRRVAVTMNVYGMAFERRVLSVFTDFDEMLSLNPLGKVPVLELDDGEHLFDNHGYELSYWYDGQTIYVLHHCYPAR